MPDLLHTGIFTALLIGLIAACWRIRRIQTQLRLRTQELREARKQEALGTFAGGIAHDFNNILGAILGFGVLLEEDLITAPEQQQMAQHINTAARRGQHIVSQLMRYSRRNLQESAHTRQPVSLDSIIRENMALLTPCIRPSVQVSYQNHAQHDVIVTDATQIGQALVNLCLNADHAIGVRTGTLHITLDNTSVDIPSGEADDICVFGGQETGDTVTLINGRIRRGKYVRIRVEDNGEGMTRDVATRIFEPFFTTKEVGVGSGLGLPALQGMIQAQGGGIIVTTTRFKGTSFELMFPLEDQDAA